MGRTLGREGGKPQGRDWEAEKKFSLEIAKCILHEICLPLAVQLIVTSGLVLRAAWSWKSRLPLGCRWKIPSSERDGETQ